MHDFTYQNQNQTRNPGFSIGYKYARDYSTFTPGPGTYQLGTALSLKKGTIFSQADRMPDLEPKSPGPGAYNINSTATSPKNTYSKENSPTSELHKVGSFSKANRFIRYNTGKTRVGPGAYDLPDFYSPKSKATKALQSVLSSPSLSKMSSLKNETILDPGPGTYDVLKQPSFHSRNKSGTFGKAPRDPFDVSRLSKGGLEGDNYYKYNFKESLGEGKNVKMSKSNRKGLLREEVREIPGPGTYDVSSPLKLTKSFTNKSTFGNSIKLVDPILRMRREEPGPGEYAVSNTSFEKGVKFPQGLKLPLPKSDAPGPGSYLINMDPFADKLKKNYSELDLIKRTSLKNHYTRLSMGTLEINQSHESVDPSNVSKDTHDINPHVARFHKNAESLHPSIRNKESRGNTQRKSFIDELIHQSSSPGPVYKVDFNSIEGTLGDIGTKFPSAAKMGYEDNRIPGPGTYDVEQIKINMGGRFLDGQRVDNSMVSPSSKYVPGVGSYEQTPEISKKGAIFAKASRWGDKNIDKAIYEQPKSQTKKKSGLDDFFLI